ncbi:hypothetical protein [Streptomyces bottropensis]|uniref:hypothetical protein n=1 Tax=Streptomyces bottropensis TaxID=42235 RepID=UPI0036A16446
MTVTTEAVIGAVHRVAHRAPHAAAGPLRPGGQPTRPRCAGHLDPPRGAHPWTGWTFSAGWGAQRTLDAVLVQPDVVMEVGVDVAHDSAGRWRRPARRHRIRADVDVQEVPLFGEGGALS